MSPFNDAMSVVQTRAAASVEMWAKKSPRWAVAGLCSLRAGAANIGLSKREDVEQVVAALLLNNRRWQRHSSLRKRSSRFFTPDLALFPPKPAGSGTRSFSAPVPNTLKIESAECREHGECKNQRIESFSAGHFWQGCTRRQFDAIHSADDASGKTHLGCAVAQSVIRNLGATDCAIEALREAA